MKNPSIKIRLTDFREICYNKSISRKKTNELFLALSEYPCPNRPIPRRSRIRKRAPKLTSVLNPKSKYYDTTPKFTKQLSLLWFNHQKSLGRLRHKRIISSDRQWVILVQIKKEIMNFIYPDTSMTKFITISSKVINESERISQKIGRRIMYVSFILSRINEVLDNVGDAQNDKITSTQSIIFDVYKLFREEATGVRYRKSFIPGSDEHELIKKVESILVDYNVTPKKFMNIQFSAFAYHKSFPRLKDLVTDTAVDRMDRAKLKDKYDGIDTKEDKKYWDEIFSKNSSVE